MIHIAQSRLWEGGADACHASAARGTSAHIALTGALVFVLFIGIGVEMTRSAWSEVPLRPDAALEVKDYFRSGY